MKIKIEREEQPKRFRLASRGMRAGIGLIAASAALAFSVLVFGPVSDRPAKVRRTSPPRRARR